MRNICPSPNFLVEVQKMQKKFQKCQKKGRICRYAQRYKEATISLVSNTMVSAISTEAVSTSKTVSGEISAVTWYSRGHKVTGHWSQVSVVSGTPLTMGN